MQCSEKQKLRISISGKMGPLKLPGVVVGDRQKQKTNTCYDKTSYPFCPSPREIKLYQGYCFRAANIYAPRKTHLYYLNCIFMPWSQMRQLRKALKDCLGLK